MHNSSSASADQHAGHQFHPEFAGMPNDYMNSMRQPMMQQMQPPMHHDPGMHYAMDKSGLQLGMGGGGMEHGYEMAPQMDPMAQSGPGVQATYKVSCPLCGTLLQVVLPPGVTSFQCAQCNAVFMVQQTAAPDNQERLHGKAPRRKKKEKKERPPRLPTPYNNFIKTELAKVKAESPNLSHREAFRTASKRWATSTENPKCGEVSAASGDAANGSGSASASGQAGEIGLGLSDAAGSTPSGEIGGMGSTEGLSGGAADAPADGGSDTAGESSAVPVPAPEATGDAPAFESGLGLGGPEFAQLDPSALMGGGAEGAGADTRGA